VVLIGKVGEGDPWTDPALLEGLPNLHLPGPRPYAQLPAYLKGFDVAMLPSTRNEYTDSMFPMKFFEYLAAGRPVVSVALPALAAFRHAAAQHDEPAAFVAALDDAIAGGAASLEARLAVAREHTYDGRMTRMLALLEGAGRARPDAAAAAAPVGRSGQTVETLTRVHGNAETGKGAEAPARRTRGQSRTARVGKRRTP
jgi:hypothetical protein